MTWNEWLKRNPDKYIRIVEGKCYIYDPSSYQPTELTNEFYAVPFIAFFDKYKHLELEINMDSTFYGDAYRFIISNTFIMPTVKQHRIVTDHELEQIDVLTILIGMKDQMIKFLFEG